MLWGSLLLAMLVMLFGWYYEGKTRNAGIVDVLWAMLMTILPLWHYIMSDTHKLTGLTATLIMSLWYLRLVWHLSGRVISEKEDGRYQHLRKHWGSKAHRNHFFFFQAQAVLAWLLTLPVWWLNQQAVTQPNNTAAVMILVLIAGIGVSIADKQLAQFREQNKHKNAVCEQGLWYYSRHPNYFFEWLHWFSYPILAIGIQHGYWLWIMPVIMLVFLCLVTGIPYTEAEAIRTKGEAYRRYQKTTSAFIPWRKKHVDD